MKIKIAAAMLCSSLAACGDDSTCEDGQEAGEACVWLGTGQPGFNGNGLNRLDTEVHYTMDMLFVSDGTIWFDDWNNHQIRRVLADGTVDTVVGWTDPAIPGDGVPDHIERERTEQGAPGLDIRLNHPTNLVESPDGYVYLMAWHNHKLRRIDPDTGQVWIVAGSDFSAGFSGDGGPAADAVFKQPQGLELDEDGNFYIGDQQNQRVRKIDAATWTIDTVVGSGEQGTCGDGGPALEACLDWEVGSNPEPSGGLVLHDGKMYIADTESSTIRVVDMTTWLIDTLAGTGEEGYSGDGGPAIDAQLNEPRDLEIGPEGDLYIADTDNNRIRAIDLDTGEIRTVVGNGDLGMDDSDGKPATETTLRRPFGIEFDPDGNLYVMDSLNNRILKVVL